MGADPLVERITLIKERIDDVKTRKQQGLPPPSQHLPQQQPEIIFIPPNPRQPDATPDPQLPDIHLRIPTSIY